MESTIQAGALPEAADERVVWTLGGVNFVTGRADLKPLTHDLDPLVAFLTQHSSREATIEGHTDSLGSAGYNHGLSQRRADAVMTYLIAHGISARRLMALGKGSSRPIAGNHTAAGRQLNGRVEVIIQALASAPQAT